MNEETKRGMTKAYFRKFPTWALGAIVVGLIACSAGGGGIAFGLLLLAAGGAAIYFSMGGKPSDQQMDEWLDEDLKALERKALSKTGTDESECVSESVNVFGPRFWDIGRAEVKFKKGGDNVLRYSPVEVSVISFTQNQLVSYKCVLDRFTGNALNEETEEYFYKDVVSVSTKTESRNVDVASLGGSLHLKTAECFTLTTSGGTSLSVFLRDQALIEKMGGGELPTTRAEKAMQAVRKMLREKKAQP